MTPVTMSHHTYEHYSDNVNIYGSSNDNNKKSHQLYFISHINVLTLTSFLFVDNTRAGARSIKTIASTSTLNAAESYSSTKGRTGSEYQTITPHFSPVAK
jgi:hypothetical protein